MHAGPVELAANFAAREVAWSGIRRGDAVVRVRVHIGESGANRIEQRHVTADSARGTDDTGWIERSRREHSVLWSRRTGECGASRSDVWEQPHADWSVLAWSAA